MPPQLTNMTLMDHIDFSKILGESKVSVPIKIIEEFTQQGVQGHERHERHERHELHELHEQPPPPPPRVQMKSGQGHHMPLHHAPPHHQGSGFQGHQNMLSNNYVPPPPPPPPPRNNQHNLHLMQKLHVQPPPPPPPLPQSYICEDNYIIPNCSANNTFMLIFMHLKDSTITLRSPKDVAGALVVFKKNLADDLDNNNNFYKKFGFSRKRALTLSGMQNDIMLDDTDTNLKPEIVTYCSKVLEKNICIVCISGGTPVRTDYVFEESAPWILIKFVYNKGYTLFIGTTPISDVIEEELFKAGYFHKIASQKVSQKKLLAKLIGNTNFSTKYA